MAMRVLKCPQCGGSVVPHRFSAQAVCPFCNTVLVCDEEVVSAATFREAFREWNSPATHGFRDALTIGEAHWELGELVARGEVADVYFARRARWPTQRVVLKIQRASSGLSRFLNEVEVLENLQASSVPGASTFCPLIPLPLLHGQVSSGAMAGSRALALLWRDGFHRTFEDVRRVRPGGIEPRQAIWIWRRILEVLSFLHASHMAHGAVLPRHLLVEDHEHGIRLVGYGCAGALGTPFRQIPERMEAACPPGLLGHGKLTPALDIAMSARSVAGLLDADPATGDLPPAVPVPLASLLREAGWPRKGESSPDAAWPLRERLGEMATTVFGPPVFCPIAM